ncbi:hypothetical protein DNTS_005406 [Danionella cerebrum]|uniref:Uncharacterized protein n=1 Tax=Danionella cerebrum TaxID=2873325 RepID=A0A553QG43_9TELE|nr:hypothetical protein DNTS_005406 [Danionella translucida]
MFIMEDVLAGSSKWIHSVLAASSATCQTVTLQGHEVASCTHSGPQPPNLINLLMGGTRVKEEAESHSLREKRLERPAGRPKTGGPRNSCWQPTQRRGEARLVSDITPFCSLKFDSKLLRGKMAADSVQNPLPESLWRTTNANEFAVRESYLWQE